MSIVERYARAATSSNLKDDEHHHQTEVLAAVALSGSALGSLLFRVKYSNDASSFLRLTDEWRFAVKQRGIKKNWPQHVKSANIASLSLNHWLNDLCQLCGGKGFLPLPDVANVLSDHACAECNGSGRSPIKCEKRNLKYVQEMIDILDEMVRRAASDAMRKLSTDMDFKTARHDD